MDKLAVCSLLWNDQLKISIAEHEIFVSCLNFWVNRRNIVLCNVIFHLATLCLAMCQIFTTQVPAEGRQFLWIALIHCLHNNNVIIPSIPPSPSKEFEMIRIVVSNHNSFQVSYSTYLHYMFKCILYYKYVSYPICLPLKSITFSCEHIFHFWDLVRDAAVCCCQNSQISVARAETEWFAVCSSLFADCWAPVCLEMYVNLKNTKTPFLWNENAGKVHKVDEKSTFIHQDSGSYNYNNEKISCWKLTA